MDYLMEVTADHQFFFFFKKKKTTEAQVRLTTNP